MKPAQTSSDCTAGLAWLACAALLAGCGSETKCGFDPPILKVSPSSATADHAAAKPGNQQQFQAVEGPGDSPGCASPQYLILLTPAWTVSDPLHVSISSAQDSTNGLATCLGPTTGAATVTANIVGTGGSVTRVAASLTCK